MAAVGYIQYYDVFVGRGEGRRVISLARPTNERSNAMPKLKTGNLHPSAEEDAAITRAALSDPDAIPYTDAEWEAAKPTIRRGRPPARSPRNTSIRL